MRRDAGSTDPSTLKASTKGQMVEACLAGGGWWHGKVEALKGQGLKGGFKASTVRLQGGLQGFDLKASRGA